MFGLLLTSELSAMLRRPLLSSHAVPNRGCQQGNSFFLKLDRVDYSLQGRVRVFRSPAQAFPCERASNRTFSQMRRTSRTGRKYWGREMPVSLHLRA